MGVMKDLHIESMNLDMEWRSLLERILGQASVGHAAAQKPNEAPVDEEEWKLYRFVPDLGFTPAGDSDLIAVEYKVLRWRKQWLARVSDAIAYMEQILARGDFTKGLIIFCLEIAPHLMRDLSEAAGERIEIWDLQKLRELAEPDPELLEALEELASETILDEVTQEHPIRPSQALRGALIADRLQATPPGQSGWQAFEHGCHDAIRFLFGRELHKLVPQQRTDDGLNRMDLIGRIRPEQNSFWAMIASDFATRYIVFEAKNYANPIGQDQIHSTFKYLMRRGLRTVAIIIAREGASSQAMKAIAGDLREDGKFILVISMVDLCAMLEGADRGVPPENLLFDRLDEALMAIGK